MTDWSEGYYTREDYTYGYYRDLSPRYLAQQLLIAGYDYSLPDDFTYLELGFGQGVCLNAHAASNPGRYWGVDFNPTQAKYAQDLAGDTSSGAIALEASFEELLSRTDLPQFDIITLHGIYSWVSAENRKNIREVIRRHLKTGGVVLVSYNAMPGWAAGHPLRELMSVVGSRTLPPSASGADILDKSFALMDRLKDMGALYFAKNPVEAKRIETLRKMRTSYLTHEFLNSIWTSFYFHEVAAEMDEAKISFACSAGIPELMPHIMLPKKANALLDEAPDETMRQTLHDYIANTQFRRDIFSRGLRKLPSHEHRARMLDQYVILTWPRTGKELTVSSLRGDLEIKPEKAEQVAKALTEAGGPMQLRALFGALGWPKNELNTFMTTILMLCQVDMVRFAFDPDTAKSHTQKAQSFNLHMARRALGGERVNILVTPTTGTAISLPSVGMAIVGALTYGHTTVKDVTRFLEKTISPSDLPLKKDGKYLSGDDYKKALAGAVGRFLKNQGPSLKRLGAI